jgi:hypothetical protein
MFRLLTAVDQDHQDHSTCSLENRKLTHGRTSLRCQLENGGRPRNQQGTVTISRMEGQRVGAAWQVWEGTHEGCIHGHIPKQKRMKGV